MRLILSVEENDKKPIFQKWDCKVFLGMFYWQCIVERSEVFWARLYIIYGISTMIRFAFEYLRSLQYHFHLIFHSEEYELEELQSLSGVLFCCLEAAISRWTQKSMPDFIINNIDKSLYNLNITICIFRLLILNQLLELKSDI